MCLVAATGAFHVYWDGERVRHEDSSFFADKSFIFRVVDWEEKHSGFYALPVR